MRKQLPEFTSKVFPLKSITIDTFDKDFNGIKEHALSFAKVVPITLDDAEKTFADVLREFSVHLVDNKIVELEKEAVCFHIKTNSVKKVSISCLVSLPKLD